MNSIQGLRDLDGIAVAFSKIAPGGFIVVEIDGAERLIARERWDALPIWGSIEAQRPKRSGPSHSALVVAVLGTMIALCEIVAWLIGRTLSAYAVAKRGILRQVKYMLCAAFVIGHMTDIVPL